MALLVQCIVRYYREVTKREKMYGKKCEGGWGGGGGVGEGKKDRKVLCSFFIITVNKKEGQK